VTLRLYLTAVFIFGLPFAQSYAVIAWACWVPNLLAAERLIGRAEPLRAASLHDPQPR
jgi:hypothetical protein